MDFYGVEDVGAELEVGLHIVVVGDEGVVEGVEVVATDHCCFDFGVLLVADTFRADVLPIVAVEFVQAEYDEGLCFSDDGYVFAGLVGVEDVLSVDEDVIAKLLFVMAGG